MNSGGRTIGRGVVLALVVAALVSPVVGATAELASGTPPLPVTAYVTNYLDDTVTPIDVATQTSGTPIPIGGPAYLSAPADIAIAPDGMTAYVTTYLSGNVLPIDVETNTAGSPITLAPAAVRAIAITPDGTTAYATGYGNLVYPIDLATSTVGTPLALDEPFTQVQYLTSIFISPDGSLALLGDGGTQYVHTIDLDAGVQGPSIAMGGGTNEIAFTPDGTTAYAVAPGGVTPIDIETLTLGTPIEIPGATAIAITSDGQTAYVATFLGQVIPIDLATTTPGSPIVVPSDGYGVDIALTTDETFAYITQYVSGTVIPIDLASATVGTPIPAGNAPTKIVITPGSVAPPDPDADNNGVADAIEVPGQEGAFSDADPPALGEGTFGQVVDANGLDVLVSDASVGGVTITTSGTGGPALFTLCAGALSVSMGTNSTATFTCGSLTVSEVSGAPVTVSLGDRVVRFPAGTAGTVEATAGGGIVFADVVGSGVTLSKGALTGPVPVGDSALIESDSRNSTVGGTAGNDLIFDSGGNNAITGGPGQDTIVTGSGNDSIEGGDGDDWIDAGDGKNKVSGGAGNDTVTTGSGADSIDGGPGTDTCNAGGGKNSVTNCS